MSKYFVTVYGRSADDLRRLQEFGLDLFPQTAKHLQAADLSHPLAIDGLISLEEAGTLVGNGYQVLLEDTVQARSATGESIEFGAWLEGMQPSLSSDKAIQ